MYVCMYVYVGSKCIFHINMREQSYLEISGIHMISKPPPCNFGALILGSLLKSQLRGRGLLIRGLD